MPLRLLIISREYPPFVGGGIGAYAARWARLLAERAAAGGAGWGAPVVVTTGPEGRMVEGVEDGITVVRLPLVAWVGAHSAGGGAGPQSVADGKTRRAPLPGTPQGRGGYPRTPQGRGGYPRTPQGRGGYPKSPPGRGGYPEGQPDWSRPHPAIATPEVEAAFRTFHPTAVFAMQVAKALPQIVARHGIGAIEAPDTGAALWFALNAGRSGGVAAWQRGEVAAEGARGANKQENGEQRIESGDRRAEIPDQAPLCHSATLPLCHSPLPPVITHLHSPTEWIEAINGAESGRAVDELRRMEADVVRWSDGLVAPSRGMAEWAAGHWGIERGRIAVIPYPIGELGRAEVAAAGAPEGASGAEGDLRVVFVGRLERRKGVDTLLAGFAAAARRAGEGRAGKFRGGEVGPRFAVRLELVGRDTPDPATGEMFGRAHFERLIPPHLRAQVTLHGELAPGEVRRMLEGAHAAVVPSPLDNFPNTCMEAMSAGRVVIAAAAGGAAEMIEDGASGLLFAPGDAEGLAGRLLELVSMGAESRARMGRAARARIVSMCDDDVVLGARLEHVRGVIEGKESGSAPPAGWMQSCLTSPRPCAAVVIGRGGASDEEVAPLVAAVESGGVRYAHGWVRDVRGGRGVIDVFGTPSEGSLKWVEGAVGPIAVERELAEELGLGEGEGVEALRRLVAAAPGEGGVVPEVVVARVASRWRWPPLGRDGRSRDIASRALRKLLGLLGRRQ